MVRDETKRVMLKDQLLHGRKSESILQKTCFVLCTVTLSASLEFSTVIIYKHRINPSDISNVIDNRKEKEYLSVLSHVPMCHSSFKIAMKRLLLPFVYKQ